MSPESTWQQVQYLFLLPAVVDSLRRKCGCLHHPITIVARVNLKLHIPDLGCLWMPFTENDGRKILHPKENLVTCQQDGTAVEMPPHPPLPAVVWPNLPGCGSLQVPATPTTGALKMSRGPLTKNVIPLPGFKV